MKRTAAWEVQFEQWFTPFAVAFGHKTRRRWAPLYVRGLLLPGDRKSVEPLASRVAPGGHQQLHHFVSISPWSAQPIEDVLLEKADAIVGSSDSHLIIDDTALPKKGDLSVGVAHQYCGALGKNANCQSLVSITLARDDIPVPVVLRLYLPEKWASDPARRTAAKVPDDVVFRPKWRIALDEIRRLIDANVRFGDVLADAGYGACGEFRQGLSALGLTWAVGISPEQRVYPTSVRTRRPARMGAGRPRKHGVPTLERRKVTEMIASLGAKAFQTLEWRRGTKGPLRAEFAAVRIRVADGARARDGIHLPGDEAWLVCERRRGGETKYYLANHSARTPLEHIAATIKARWACEQAHQQLKEELGLDHYEGRSWDGLHRHALMTLIAFAFLQDQRLREKKG